MQTNRLRPWHYSAHVSIPFSDRKTLAQVMLELAFQKGTAGIRNPGISCLLNRRFNQLSHGASLQGLRGGLANQSPAALALLCTPVCIPFSDRKTTKPKVDARAHLPKAPLGFEPRISCLQDRRIDQLCHGALLDPAFFGSS